MAGITVKEIAAASVTTPATNKNTIFFDTADGLLKFKNDAGAVTILQASGTIVRELQLSCSDLTTALTTGAAKAYVRAPRAMTVTAVRASLLTAQTGDGGGGIFTVDINDSGTSILSTKLTIDNTEKTSTTAATPAVISDSAIADDAEITIDIDQIGDGTAKGLIVSIFYT